jgi:hypothetical protein
VVEGVQQAMTNEANAANSDILSQMTNLATRASKSQQQLQAQIQHMQHAMGVLQSQVTNQVSQQNRGYQQGPPLGYQPNGYQGYPYSINVYRDNVDRGSMATKATDIQAATDIQTATDIKATASSTNGSTMVFRDEAGAEVNKDEETTGYSWRTWQCVSPRPQHLNLLLESWRLRIS